MCVIDPVTGVWGLLFNVGSEQLSTTYYGHQCRSLVCDRGVPKHSQAKNDRLNSRYLYFSAAGIEHKSCGVVDQSRYRLRHSHSWF